MSDDPSASLQRGIYALLTSDPDLMGMVGGVVDEPPETMTGPIVLIGRSKQTIPDNTSSGPGRQNVIQFDTFTRARSSLPGDEIGARIVALLDLNARELDALVEGHKVWSCRWEYSQSLDDPAAEMRHRVDRFRIRTSSARSN